MKKSKSNKRTKKRGGTAWFSSLFGWGSSAPAATPPVTQAANGKTAMGQAATDALQTAGQPVNGKAATQPVNGKAAGQTAMGQAAGQPAGQSAGQSANGSHIGGSRRRKPKRKTKKL